MRRSVSSKPQVHIERIAKKGTMQPIKKTMEALDWKKTVKPNSKVVIKINGCHYKFLPGLVTEPNTVGQLVKILKTRASEVVVVESDLQRVPADVVFDQVGYRKVVEKAGGVCSNLTSEKQIKSKLPGGQYWKTRKMPQSLCDNDVYINMPIIKTHKLWLVSFNIKNQFGCVPEEDRVKYQKFLPQVVGDFNAFCPPDLCIVDGTVGLEGDGPIAGIPKKVDLIVGGNNLVATDAALCKLTGFDPLKSGLIKNCYERGLGPIEMKKIEFTGVSPKKVAMKYKPPSDDIISRMEREVRKHPKLAEFIYRSWFFSIAKRTAWAVRGMSGYKSSYHEEIAKTGLWEDYDWEHLLQVYKPIA